MSKTEIWEVNLHWSITSITTCTSSFNCLFSLAHTRSYQLNCADFFKKYLTSQMVKISMHVEKTKIACLNFIWNLNCSNLNSLIETVLFPEFYQMDTTIVKFWLCSIHFICLELNKSLNLGSCVTFYKGLTTTLYYIVHSTNNKWAVVLHLYDSQVLMLCLNAYFTSKFSFLQQFELTLWNCKHYFS